VSPRRLAAAGWTANWLPQPLKRSERSMKPPPKSRASSPGRRIKHAGLSRAPTPGFTSTKLDRDFHHLRQRARLRAVAPRRTHLGEALKPFRTDIRKAGVASQFTCARSGAVYASAPRAQQPLRRSGIQMHHIHGSPGSHADAPARPMV